MPRKSKSEREAEQSLALQRKKLVDEYGQLDSELTPVKAKQRRMEELGKIIRSWHATADPEVSLASAGDRYEVVLGAAGMQTHINDISEVYRSLGHEQFLKLSSVSLRSLEVALDSAAVASLTRKERTGYRSIIVRGIAS